MCPDDGINVRQFTSGGALHRAYAEQRKRCPVAYNDSYGGHFMLTRYDDVKRAASDWESFSSADGILLPQDPRPMIPPIEFDPPQHTYWRSVFRDLLSRQTRRLLEAGVVEHSDRLIDAFAPKGAADLIAEFAEPIPVLAIAALIGLDSDLAPRMRQLALAVSHSHGTPGYQGAMDEFASFALEQVDLRRRRPGGDFLTTVATREFEGSRLTDDQVVGVLIALMVAGHHSTVSGLSSVLLRILAEPGLKEEIRENPSRLVRAIEETIRLDTPLHQFRRRTTREVQVGTVTIPEGANVLLNYAAANRDPVVYDRPDEFDLDRDAEPHLGFGFGIHTCAGAPLARAELRIAAQRLLDRLPDIELAGDPPEHEFHGHLLMLGRLDAVFSPVA